MIGITTRSLFVVDAEQGKAEVIGAVAGKGRLGLGAKGSVFGKDAGDALWRMNLWAASSHGRRVKLPVGAWDKAPLTWARDANTGLLYTADGEGNLFSFDEEHGFSGPLGRTPLAPVRPDGRDP